jgi:very-short-patch-repair endonuclease
MPIKRKIIPYNPELKSLAKDLRRNMTLSEVLLWNELKQKQMLGFDFDRQRPLRNYIVDFYCKELSLAIEIDGDTHIYKYDYDDERQRSLEKLGVHFLRFEDIEVKKNMNNVLRVIEDWIRKNKPTPKHSKHVNFEEKPTPNPSKEGNFEEKPTHGPSKEGNLLEKNLRSFKKPTPSPSGEGNFEEKHTPNPSKEGNFGEKHTPGPSKEGNIT